MAFRIIRHDITKVVADAIVNTANPDPVYKGGTDQAIYMAAGAEELLAEREKIGKIPAGQVAATPALALHAKYIIHTVGPQWVDGAHGETEAVRSCYENSLRLAKELGCESIAFPLLATGIYGFPKAESLSIAVSVFSEFLTNEEMEITLAVFDEESFTLSGRIFTGVDEFINENYVEEKLKEEYKRRERTPRRAENSLHFLNRRSNESAPDHFRLCSEETEYAEDEEDSEPVFAEAEPAEAGIAEEPELCFEDEEPVAEQPKYVSPKKTARSLEDLMAQATETWQESLFRLIDEKGYLDTEVYKRANLDRKLFSKIRCNTDYRPKKNTAVAFALALKLNLDETKDFLARAGYALSPCSKFDLIIEYFILQEVYDTYTINLALFEHDQPLLGE
ncbi:MAG: macro domain-containing protein [Lachnospiraceae bacterium]|nr:macro domain-containing protein [Lachnospiraceae bacterium]